MKRSLSFLISLSLLIVLFTILPFSLALESGDVLIHEVCASGSRRDGGRDWIELYNRSDTDIDISGWFLSDSLKDAGKWCFPTGTVIPSGGFLVFSADAASSKSDLSVIPFNISASGETLLLTDANGVFIDRFETGTLRYGLSSGRTENDPSGARLFFTEPTPAKPNGNSGYSGYTAAPVFSDTNLYRSESFSLSLSCSDTDAVITYTLDGSVPTSSSQRFESSAPLLISSSCVVRAAAFNDEKLESEISTCTYLFETPHTLPVVSVAIAPDDFKKVSTADKKNKPEREAYLSFYEADGSLGISFPAGMKVKGQSTASYRKKSFSLDLRARYGRKDITYPFFPGCECRTFTSLVLRNGGQDHSRCILRDSFSSRIVRGMHLDYAETRPVVVYINGSYHGLYYLDEELNSGYLASHYGVNADHVDFVKRNNIELKGSNDGYLEARNTARNSNLSDDSLFAEFARIVDVDYCTDYIIAQTFIINGDMYNQKFWHSDEGPILWRPVFYDLDCAFSEGTSPERSLFGNYFSESGVASADGSKTNLDVFVGLKKNAAWREKFIERYFEILGSNFSAENLLAIFDEMADEIRPEIERNCIRWGHPSSAEEWEEHIAKMRELVAARPAGAVKNLIKYFRISDEKVTSLSEKYGVSLSN